MSFRARLTVYCASGIALVLIVGSVVAYVLVRDQLRGQVDASLTEHSDLIFVADTSASAGAGVDVERDPRDPRILKPNLGTRIQIAAPAGPLGSAPSFALLIDRRGKTVFPSAEGVELPIPDRAVAVARGGRGSYFTDVRLDGVHLRMRVSPAPENRALLIARSLAEVDRALNRLAWSLAITCLFGILLAGVVGAIVARRALRPVQELTATAERITETRDLGERIETAGEDELSRLGTTFNSMLDSLESTLQAQRRLVSDASHELRTPLTTLRTNIDVLRSGTDLDSIDRTRLLKDIGDEIEALTALVASLVDLARGSQRELHLVPVELHEIAEATVERARARFPYLLFETKAEPTSVWGDPAELERAIWNLLENASKWSSAGSSVEIDVRDGEVEVRDSGPGVDASDKPFVFDRFYRSESARGAPGSGLGLAIVRQVAESHGGSVKVEDAEGGGALFRLSLLECA